MNEERKPGLQAQMQQSKARMLDIKIQVQALAQFQVRLQHFGLVIASHLISPTRLYASKDRHQALFDPVSLSEFPRLLFLGESTAGQIGEWARQGSGQLFGTLAYLGGQSGGKLLEVLKQHFGPAQILLKNPGNRDIGANLESGADQRSEESP